MTQTIPAPRSSFQQAIVAARTGLKPSPDNHALLAAIEIMKAYRSYGDASKQITKMVLEPATPQIIPKGFSGSLDKHAIRQAMTCLSMAHCGSSFQDMVQYIIPTTHGDNIFVEQMPEAEMHENLMKMQNLLSDWFVGQS